MKKLKALFRFTGRHYITFIVISVITFILGIFCIPFKDGTWWMPIGHLLSEHPNITVGIVLILLGLFMQLFAIKCKYKKQKGIYIGLNVLIVVDGIIAITNIIGANLIFDIAFMLLATQLYGYAFFKNPEEPKASFDILEAGISAIILTIVIVCNICGVFTFNHPIALPRTLGIAIALLGLVMFTVALLYKLPKGTEEREQYDMEKRLKRHERKRKKLSEKKQVDENVSEKEVEMEGEDVQN